MDTLKQVHPLNRLQRPLVLGLSIGHPSGTGGSIGAFVVMPDGKRGLISSASVLAPKGAKTGDRIHQPGPLDTKILTGDTRVATLSNVVDARPGEYSRVHAATAELLEGIETCGNLIPDPSPDAGHAISGIVNPVDLRAGDEVAFAGRTSGFSKGHIVAIEMTRLAVGNLSFDDAVAVSANVGSFSRPGDGGALVYRRSDYRAIGMIFAAATLENGKSESYLLPLGPALDALNVKLLSYARKLVTA